MARSPEAIQTIRAKVQDTATMNADLIKLMGIGEEEFARITLNAFTNNRSLGECTIASIEKCVLDCANMGVLPDGHSAAIVKFKNEAKVMLMVGGMLAKVRLAIPGISIRTNVIRSGDEYEYTDGLEPILTHTPSRQAKISNSPEDIVAAYAVAKIPKGGTEFVFMYKNEIDYHRNFSRARRDDSPWKMFYAEMAVKTVLRQLLKILPHRGLLSMMLGHEEEPEQQEEDTVKGTHDDPFGAMPTKPDPVPPIMAPPDIHPVTKAAVAYTNKKTPPAPQPVAETMLTDSVPDDEDDLAF